MNYVHRRYQLLLTWSVALLLFLTACGDLESAGNVSPGEGSNADAPTGSFGVSLNFGGPFLNDADGAIAEASDERVISVEPGGKFYVQVNYEDPDGISSVAVNLVNASPEGLAGTLDPTQSFFTLGQPTGISEPSSACDLSDIPTSVTCIYEVRVAEDAVNIDALENSGDEFAYVFRTKVTDAAGNISDEAERGYVTVTDDEGETPEPKPEPETCTDPVNIPDKVLQNELREYLGLAENAPISCEDLAGLTDTLYIGSREREEIISIRTLEGLQFARNLKRLFITETVIEDYTAIADLTSLDALELQGLKARSLEPLRNLTELTYLKIVGHGAEGSAVENEDALASLVNLENIEINSYGLENITSLQNLTKLFRLDLRDNNISDITPLVRNNDLDEGSANPGNSEGDFVFLDDNPLETCPGSEDRADIDALIERGVEVFFDEPENCDGEGGNGETCTNPVNIPDEVLRTQLRKALGLAEDAEITCSDLANLTVFEYTVDRDDPDPIIESLEGLQYAVNLEEIDLFSNSVSDLSPLRDLPVLTKLDLSGNDVSSLEPLSDSKSLRSLAVEDIADLSPLGSLTELLNLSISTPDPSPDNLAVLGQLTNLQDLSLTNSAVSDLSFTQSLDALKELELRSNNLSTLESIGDLPSLEQLILNRNPIQDVTPLADLPQGLTLSLSVPLDDLKGLSELTNLGAIQGGFFSGTKDISQLAALEQLVAVSLPFEQITDITPLAELKQLVALDLSGNQITDITPLSELTNLCYVQLGTNTIEDIEPLVISSDNGGFSRNGCFIDLDTNPLSTDPDSQAREDIDTLRSRGIRVGYKPYPAE